MARVYKEGYPSSQASSYPQNKAISILVNIPSDKEFVAGSLKIHGDLKVLQNNAAINTGTPAAPGDSSKVYFDSQAGAHCLFDQFSSKILNVGITELISEYPRWVKMMTQVNASRQELMNSTAQNVELKTGSDESTNSLMNGFLDPSDSAAVKNKISFAIKPMIFLNRSNRNFTGKEVSQFTLDWVLNDPSKCFFGDDNTGAKNITYSIANLKISYAVQDIQKTTTQVPLLFNRVSVLRHSINSALANIELIPTIASLSVSSTVELDTDFSNRTKNSFDTQKINISNLRYLVNDSNGKLISYNIDSNEELEYLYVKSLQTGNNVLDTVRPADYAKRFGFGLTFETVMMAGQKVTVQINSDADVAKKYQVFTVVNGIVGL